MQTPWQYIQNPFDNSTKDNYKKFFEISQHHLNALNTRIGDAFFDALIADYLPKHNGYRDLYNLHQTSEGTQKGKTATFEQLLDTESSTKIREWDIAIQGVHAQGSGRYIELLPNRRKPFQSGTRDERVNAVRNLSLAIGTDAALAAVKTDVDAFYGELTLARSTQQTTITATSEFSEDLEDARVVGAQGMYKNLGALMNKYYNDTDAIVPFFDLEKIRTHEQVQFIGSVIANSTLNIFKRTVEGTQKVRIINTGTVALTFCFANEKNDVCALPSITVAPGEEEIVDASLLGNVPGSKFFNVTNNAAVEGDYEVTLL
jgi:hypothetical protein